MIFHNKTPGPTHAHARTRARTHTRTPVSALVTHVSGAQVAGGDGGDLGSRPTRIVGLASGTLTLI